MTLIKLNLPPPGVGSEVMCCSVKPVLFMQSKVELISGLTYHFL